MFVMTKFARAPMRRLILFLPTILLVAIHFLAGSPLVVSSQQRLDDLLRDGLQYRNLGPFRAGSWVSDIAVPDAPRKWHLYTLYVAARRGGVWTTNNSATPYQPASDNENEAAIGALAT